MDCVGNLQAVIVARAFCPRHRDRLDRRTGRNWRIAVKFLADAQWLIGEILVNRFDAVKIIGAFIGNIYQNLVTFDGDMAARPLKAGFGEISETGLLAANENDVELIITIIARLLHVNFRSSFRSGSGSRNGSGSRSGR